MKAAAKLAHLLWAGAWSTFLIWFAFRDGLGDIVREPYLLAVPAFAVAWLVFAVFLVMGRSWSWYGCFMLAVLSLFVAYYVAWFSIAAALHGSGSFSFELLGAAAATVVVFLLLQSRHQFLRGREADA